MKREKPLDSARDLRSATKPKKAIDVCKRIMERRGPTYLSATKLFKKEFREATYAIYAFLRIPDDYVDLETKAVAQQKLKSWKENWIKALRQTQDNALHYPNEESQSKEVLKAAAWVFERYNMEEKWAEDFLFAMESDLHKERYENYAELQGYMWGSAGVVGMMMTKLAKKGKIDEETKKYAVHLAEAMQMTNFLRDILEDYKERNRIYIPKEDLERFGVDESWFENQKNDEAWQNLLDFLIKRVEKDYKEAWKGIKKLPRGFAGAVGASAELYARYLTKIKAQKTSYWAGDFRLGRFEKLCLSLKGFVKGALRI